MKVYILLCLLLLKPWIICLCKDDVALPVVEQAVVGDDVPRQCWNFTIGDTQRREFYSPRHPNNYINNTECIKLLVAPEGKRIRLDFRDEFHIEKSDECKYDFLEVRDGPFGYSTNLGTYCGEQHPPMRTSTSRFMWLRFRTDDSIEYAGFRAVYDYFTPSEEAKRPKRKVCYIDVSLTNGEAYLTSGEVSEKLKEMSNSTGMPIDCTWVVYAPPGHKVTIKVINYTMSEPLDSCDSSFMEAYEQTTAHSNRVKQWCGAAVKEGHKSGNNLVYLRMYASTSNLVPFFRALVTVYVPAAPDCPQSLFDCGDGMCVNKLLKCNGHQNCDRSLDEMYCEKGTPVPTQPPPPLMNQSHVIVLGVVGGILFTVICISVVITCRQRHKEEVRRRHALKQQRRHNEIELTNLLTRSPHQNPSPHSHRVMNHVDATPVPAAASGPVRVGNHIATNTNGNGPKAHTLPRRKGSSGTGAGAAGAATGQTSEFDISDLYAHSNNDGVTFRRYLDVHNYNNDEDSSPNPSIHRDIPALVTVERPPLGISPSPSPRKQSHEDPGPRRVSAGAGAGDKHFLEPSSRALTEPSLRERMEQNPRERIPLNRGAREKNPLEPSSRDRQLQEVNVRDRSRPEPLLRNRNNIVEPQPIVSRDLSKRPLDPGVRTRNNPFEPSARDRNPQEPPVRYPNPPESRVFDRNPQEAIARSRPPLQRSSSAGTSRDRHLLEPPSTRDRAPSPRPDVVQEERLMLPQPGADIRRLSVDTVKSDKSDVWKPITQEMFQYSVRPPPPAVRRPQMEAHYTPPHYTSQQQQQQQQQLPLQLPRPKSPRPQPVPVHAQNTMQQPPVAAPVTKYPPKSPRLRGSKSPPKPPKRTTESLSTPRHGATKSSKDNTPDIFFTRPNRGVTRHHPV